MGLDQKLQGGKLSQGTTWGSALDVASERNARTASGMPCGRFTHIGKRSGNKERKKERLRSLRRR